MPGWNTCGQAAVADTLVELRLWPERGDASHDSRMAELLERFPPDVPLGFGTSVFRLRAALRSHGVECELVHSGWRGASPTRVIARVVPHVAAGLPALVCVDLGLLGGRAWEAHWARLERLDDAAAVLWDAAGRTPVEREPFLRAWRCRHLPWPHHHAALLARRA